MFGDADIEEAVAGAAMAVFSNTGQICSVGMRLFVEKRSTRSFTHCVAKFGKKLNVGDGTNPETQIGPLVSNRQLERVTGYLDVGAREGARALTGGRRLMGGSYDKGYFGPPTLFGDMSDSMTIAREEIFGPVISALPFEHFEDLVERANGTPFGLGSGLWTRDISKAHRLAGAIRAGTVWSIATSLWTRPFHSVALQDERLRPRSPVCSTSRSSST